MPNPNIQINRKHTVNEHYFDEIITEHQAYWLGFLWADGNISKTAKRCAGMNRITLAQKANEIKHLQNFKKDLCADYPITTRPRIQNHLISTLHINSRLLCIALENLGFGAKDNRTVIPNIPQNLMHHFIRGYFDGDGCLSVYVQNVKNKWFINKQELSFTGNPVFIKNLKHTLEQKTDVTRTVSIKTYAKTSKATSLRYGKKTDVDILFHYMYDDATIYLDSKYQKFLKFYSR